MDENTSIPSYTPTPIWLLDQPEGARQNVEYNPTPIDELDRYAPSNFSIAYEPRPLSYSASEVPTYSPVVPNRDVEGVSAKPFGYSPLKYGPRRDISNVDNYGVGKHPSAERVDEESEKRKKILSLYTDLYDSHEKPAVPTTRRISLPKSTSVSLLFYISNLA